MNIDKTFECLEYTILCLGEANDACVKDTARTHDQFIHKIKLFMKIIRFFIQFVP